jgi:hypothetical protein
MLLKILGGIDVISGLILVILSLNINIYEPIIIFLGVVLLAKSLIGLFKDFASWTDFISGVVLLSSSSFEIPSFVMIILGIVVLQKGVISFL